MKPVLSIGSLLGAVTFLLVFGVTFLSVSVVEESARSFVINQIEREVAEQQVGGVSMSEIGEKLSWLKGQYGDQIRSLEQRSAGGVRAHIEEILARICNLECLKAKGISVTEPTDDYLRHRISQLSDASEKLTELVKGRYYRIISELLHDLRIFSGINLLLFTAIAGLLQLRSGSARILTLPAGLLFVATVVGAGIYLFGQNWFYTLLFSDYVGWGYLAYVGVIFGFLLDIVFNGAAITTGVVDAIASFIKSVAECFP